MKKFLATGLATALIFSGSADAAKNLVIREQGSFIAGGTVISREGKTMHGDHAYAFYQIPAKARKYPLIFLHGAGQSGKTWETTQDGREGFQNIFLRKGYGVYIVDQPRRGRAGLSTVAGNYEPILSDQMWFNIGRIGEYPRAYDGVAAPTDADSLDQMFRFGTPNVAAFDTEVISGARAAIFERAGNGIFVTHSQGGGIGWATVIKSDKVKAVISLEPGSGFVFPEGEVPAPMPSSSPFGELRAEAISAEDFARLTKIPILLIYGDNIPSGDKPVENWRQDNWRVRLNMARLWVDAINRHGGDATLIHLPEIGIYGNTHSLMADKNNLEVAGVMEQWLKSKRLY